MDILAAEKLTLAIQGRQILKDLSLSVETGTIHSILGPNAAGKSSLAYTLLGCSGYAPQTGRIHFKERHVTDYPLSKRAKMGMTLAWQEPAKFEGLKVKDYIAVGLRDKSQYLLEEALHYVLLDPKDYLDRVVDKTLSGGERKRIELASVFAMKPELAILDEPDSGIDILALENIVDMIKELKERGTTVLLITHRQEVSGIADSTSLICSGFIVKEGRPDQVGEYFKEQCIPCPTHEYAAQEEKKENNARL